MPAHILIVDDERLTRTTLELLLDDEGFQVHTATNGYEAVSALEEQGPFEIVLTDLRMPSMSGLELQRTIRERWPDVDVLLMTAFGSVNTAVQAMRNGATDYLTKPLNTEDLLIRLQRLLARRREREEIHRLREDARQMRRNAGDAIFRSDRMAATVERALSVADTDATVLLQGETGTGKEVLARLIHARSNRSSGPFVVVNCAELNINLVESELFGHEAGSFTGAVRQRRGRFESAMGGTLLIDEVDDLPRGIQVRLLRFLQDRSFERVGSSKTIRGDVRVLCATKRSLEELVSQGKFREDLYYRINTIAIELPPLRHRREDILPLAQHFVARYAEQRGYDGLPELEAETLRVLLAHNWPGNVRELEHAIEHAVTFCRGAAIAPAHLPPSLSGVADEIVSLHLEGRESVCFTDVVNGCERRLVEWALGRTGGNQLRAAELLNMSRTTLRSRLASLKAAEEKAASRSPELEVGT